MDLQIQIFKLKRFVRDRIDQISRDPLKKGNWNSEHVAKASALRELEKVIDEIDEIIKQFNLEEKNKKIIKVP